jgi:histidinol-phosphate/aromatic aminotransferase/cobyric acid decarboxylase-like protein
MRLLAQAAGKPEREIIDFSANLNPLGPPEWLRARISSKISDLVHYPDPESSALVEAIAEHHGVAPEEIITGNGSSELLYLIPRALGNRCIIPVPSYVDYARASLVAGKEIFSLPLREEEGFALNLDSLKTGLVGGELVFIGQPNNPTGTICDAEALRELAKSHPSTVFVVDEAFADFVENLDRLTRNRPPNIIVLLSLTKIFAMPGLRLACAIADRAIIRRLRELQPPWSVNALAQAVGASALRDREYLERTRSHVREQRERFIRNRLERSHRLSGYANFLLVMDRPGLNAPTLARELLAQGWRSGLRQLEGLMAVFPHMLCGQRRKPEAVRCWAGAGRILRNKKPALMIQAQAPMQAKYSDNRLQNSAAGWIQSCAVQIPKHVAQFIRDA